MKRAMVMMLTLLLVLSCSSIDEETDKDELIITFDPSTVHQSDNGAWYFKVFVATRGNVGVTVKLLTIKNYNMSGEFVSEQRVEPIKFAQWFDDCGGEGSFIEPGVQRCAEIYAWGNPGTRKWVMEGIDDLGFSVSSTAEITLR